MPGFYAEGEYDLAGFIVGVVDRPRLIIGTHNRALVTCSSAFRLSGLHTNGYSLARRVVFEHLRLTVDSYVPELSRTVGDALLEPHRSYLPLIRPLLDGGRIKGMAHITGGGITDNLPRVLPHGTAAAIDDVSLGSAAALPVAAAERQRARRRHDADLQHGHRTDHRDRAGTMPSRSSASWPRAAAATRGSSAKSSPANHLP